MENDGADQTSQMFEAVGKAITRWSFVESELCSIFTICIGDVALLSGGGLDFGDASAETAVFYSVENFRGKLGLVDAALGVYLRLPSGGADDLKHQWEKIGKKVREMSRRRNKIAHYTVLPGHETDQGVISPRLVPPHGSPGYWRETGSSPGKQTVSLHHLQQLEYAFYLVEQKLSCFARALAAHEGLFDKDVQQLQHRIRAHLRTSQSRSDTLKLALSSFQ